MQTYKYNAAPSASCHTCGKLSSKQWYSYHFVIWMQYSTKCFYVFV
jgi:DNA-directed RNA polymerase subunit N (RpoN/RPB10)